MILTALNDLAHAEELVVNPHYEEKKVEFLIVVDAAGQCLGLQERMQELPGKKKPLIPAMLVPRPFPGARRSGTKIDPGFLVDNASFVLGLNAPGDAAKKAYPSEELRNRQEQFRGLVAAAEQATGDEALQAVRLFMDQVIDKGWRIAVPDNLKSNALFAFLYAPDVDVPVHQRAQVVDYWGRLRAAHEQPTPDGAHSQCLVTGARCVAVDKHPPIKKVPGGSSSGIALVSFNNDTFESYGLERNQNAPICRQAAEAYTTALARLLDADYPDPKTRVPMPRRNFRLSADTVVLYWSRAPSQIVDLFSDAIQAEPEAVNAILTSAWKGQPVNLKDPTAFYALTLSGGQGRGTIRSWFETTVREVVSNVRMHFEDLKIVRPTFEADAPVPLWLLLRTTAVQGKEENIHPNLASELFLAILQGRCYSRELLSAALLRARAEREMPSARAALIKAYLVRAKRHGRLTPDFPEVTQMLDHSCNYTGYRLGRLFAVLEKAQEDATNASTTIRDRFYGAASATPVTVFAQLLRKLPHHLGKLDHAVFYEKLIQEIVGPLPPENAFPSTLSLEQQGLFALGYYHQRQDLFTKRETKIPSDN